MRFVTSPLLFLALAAVTASTACAQTGKSGVQPDGCATFTNNTLGSLGVPCSGAGTAPGGSPFSLQYNNNGALGGVNITGLVLGIGAGLPRAAIPSDILSLLATPGGATTYLRSDGAWATPAGGSASTPVTTSNCSGTQSIALTSTAVYDVTLTGNCTFSFTGATGTGTFQTARLIIRPSGFTWSLPGSSGAIIWAGGTPPTQSSTTPNATVTVLLGSTGVAPILGNL